MFLDTKELIALAIAQNNDARKYVDALKNNGDLFNIIINFFKRLFEGR